MLTKETTVVLLCWGFLLQMVLLGMPRGRAMADEVGINLLKPEVCAALDEITNAYRDSFDYAQVGIVAEGIPAYTRSYKEDNLADVSAWCSISKPATAMIVMQLVDEGVIGSLDDNVWDYHDFYQGCMPSGFGDALTLRHLLTHSGGLDYAAPLWSGDHLDLGFVPGTQHSYSTAAFGIVGDVIRGATGKSFNTLIQEYVRDPVAGADSWYAVEQDEALREVTYSSWQSPASFVYSTIEDLTRFSAGVMNNVYVSETVFRSQMLNAHFPLEQGAFQGLSWFGFNEPDGTLIAFHTGNNGREKSVLVIDLDRRMSAAVMFYADDLEDERIPWARDLLEALRSFPEPMAGSGVSVPAVPPVGLLTTALLLLGTGVVCLCGLRKASYGSHVGIGATRR